MPRIRPAILVLSVAVYAALSGGFLHAEDKTDSRETCEKAASLLLNSVGKCCNVARQTWCPNDYRPKCPPCICPPTYCGSRVCYDVKCPPCICPPRYCGGCDCYDAKCAPCVKRPWYFPSYYKCPPKESCFIPGAKPGVEKTPGE
jgi:hypothetical protein